MSTLRPHVPDGWRVVGVLRDAEKPELLDSHMVEVTYPNSKLLIYAGWEPEEYPTGRYVVGALDGCDSAVDPVHVASMDDAADLIYVVARVLATGHHHARRGDGPR